KSIITSLHQPQRLFTAAEYNQLAALRYKLDDELNGGAWSFVNLLTNLYGTALKRSDSLVNAVLQKPIDFIADDKITFTRQPSFQFGTNVLEMRQRWQKWFKWQMLNSGYDMMVIQPTKTSLKDLLTKNEAALRQKIKREALAGVRQFQSADDLALYLRNLYLNAIATTFDPHTYFFSPTDKEDFESELSTENKSFGFVIDDKDGKVVVQNLIPGGSAWKSGDLHGNDQVMQIGFKGKEDVDVTMLTADEVNDLIKEGKEENLVLKIKKSDGSIKTVALQKDKIETEENSVKGYVLTGSKKIGYISLPDFYTAWHEGGASCANDMAKEIVNLKKEGIEGLILDVRYNGGGSLQEALELIGIFIDQGPLVGIKERVAKPAFLKDPYRGTIFDGPMAVMINGQSASASEALAASLQDYKRAVIVGSATYGKGTMQQIFAMDTTAEKKPNATSPHGFVKITVGKFYRLDGSTAQLQGVQPDVPLPDSYELMKIGEKFSEFALASDTVKRNSYYQPLTPLPAKELASNSTARVTNAAGFSSIKKWTESYRAVMNVNEQTVPIKIESFEKWRAAQDAFLFDEEPTATEVKAGFTIGNHVLETQRLQNNSYAKDLNEGIMENLLTDIYLDEAYRIICDLILLKKK
ncbi:MAG: carboxy terminal-processing peptidase, partial [Bacteroidota bacterium]